MIQTDEVKFLQEQIESLTEQNIKLENQLKYLSTLKMIPALEPKTCPTCDQTVKLYPRKIHSNMAAGLIILSRLSTKENGDFKYVHMPSIVTNQAINYSNMSFGLLERWGLAVPMPNDDNPKKNKSGYWKISEKGLLFAEEKITVDKYVYMYNSKKWNIKNAPPEKQVTIKDALSDHFDYEELMRFGRSK